MRETACRTTRKQYGDLYNLRGDAGGVHDIPLAKHDVERYPRHHHGEQNGTPYYTNSSHLPVGYTDDMFRRWISRTSCRRCTRPARCSMRSWAKSCPDWKAAASLVRKIAENYKLPYYTCRRRIPSASNHGYIAGRSLRMPGVREAARRKTEVYSRITGYYRPVQNWNAGKAAGVQGPPERASFARHETAAGGTSCRRPFSLLTPVL
jgi:anaerobic ribonucleoside-triphosphate reductase